MLPDPVHVFRFALRLFGGVFIPHQLVVWRIYGIVYILCALHLSPVYDNILKL